VNLVCPSRILLIIICCLLFISYLCGNVRGFTSLYQGDAVSKVFISSLSNHCFRWRAMSVKLGVYIRGDGRLCLANESAVSLPFIPMWLGIQIRLIFGKILVMMFLIGVI